MSGDHHGGVATVTPRTWLPDPSHYPEQMTPLSATVWFEALGNGAHEALRQLRAPFAGFETRTELGWAYEGDLEPDWDVDPEGLQRAARTLPERWEQELRPRSWEITRELHAMRPEAPGPAAAALLFDRAWDVIRDHWVVHFLAVFPAQAAIELWSDAWRDAFGPDDGLSAYRALAAGPNGSDQADAAVWRLARRAEDAGLGAVILEYPPDAALQRLRELADGRRWLQRLDEYLRRYGGRSRWHELSIPREAERPWMTMESLRLLISSGAAEPVMSTAEAMVEERLRGGPAELAELLPLARFAYGLKEGHVYHIDYPGLLATREVLLGFGRRLVAEGTLRSLDDVWFVPRPELRDLVAGVARGGPTLEEKIESRREDLRRGLGEGPRPYLGEPPPEADRPAMLEKFYGTASAGGAGDGSLAGTGASSGVGVGNARVVLGAEDFARVRPGDVLVAPTTTPAWTPLFPALAGLVTETGGILSHAAIVAREYGIPTVVGVNGATRRIADGARVSIDGDEGTVRFVANG
jgi:phosphohistidine swiveling domain-containing protein